MQTGRTNFRRTNRLIFGRLERRFFPEETNKSTAVRHKFTSDGQMSVHLSVQTICSSLSAKTANQYWNVLESRLILVYFWFDVAWLRQNQISFDAEMETALSTVLGLAWFQTKGTDNTLDKEAWIKRKKSVQESLYGRWMQLRAKFCQANAFKYTLPGLTEHS